MKTTKNEWVDFIHKLDWEGGIIGMLEYGGWAAFPGELCEYAERVEIALAEIQKTIDSKREEFGIEEE